MVKNADLRAIANRSALPSNAKSPAMVGRPSGRRTAKDYLFYGFVGFFGLSALGSVAQILEDPSDRQARLAEQARQTHVRALERRRTEAESGRREKEAAKQARNEACTSVEYVAYARSQEAVRARLKAPSTARFPWAPTLSKHIGDCKFEVLAYVDAQNGFGAMIRTVYAAALTYNPNTEAWRVNMVKLIE